MRRKELIPAGGFSALFRTKNGSVELRHPDMQQSTTPLEEKHLVMLHRLESMGYTSSTIKGDRWFCGKILRESTPETRWAFYQSVFRHYSQEGNKPVLVLIRRWMVFDIFDILPEDSPIRAAHYNAAEEHLEDHFRLLVDAYRSKVDGELRASTIRVEAGTLSSFLLFCQEHGISSLEEINEMTFREYRISTGVSCAILKRLSAALERLGLPCKKLFPRAQAVPHKVYPHLTKDELAKLTECLLDPSSPITPKERAVGLLLVNTGMRGKDVRDLTIDHIDWHKQTVRFTQSKTGDEVEVPILPVVANALYDYILTRPKCALRNVFVSDRAKRGMHTPIYPHSVVDGIFSKCNLRQDERRGTHLFRHACATSLLNQGTDLAVISNILGHQSPSSTMTYLSADLDALRECSIPVHPSKAKLYDKH